jgi:agmatine deiminase
MARVISQKERVRLLVRDGSERDRAAKMFDRAGVKMDAVDFVIKDTNRSWTRDSMPIWVTKKSGKGNDRIAVKFRFDGWSRYRDHRLDESAGLHVAKRFEGQHYLPRDANGGHQVLEGGAIDVDGRGTLLTTSSCLVTSARARFSGGKLEAEGCLNSHLGVRKIIWLPDGIVGDDTSGHVDDFARFAPKNKILLCQESRKSDENYEPLKAARRSLRGSTCAREMSIEVIPLPMPSPVTYAGDRLPASYANFYVANAAVLVPVFNDPADRDALSIIAQCFPDRPTVGIYARDLVVGLGTLHCSTMQEPT